MAHICLSPEHIADLQKSGLNKVTIEKLKFRSVSPNELNKLGGKFSKVVSAYEIPYFELFGNMKSFKRLKLFPPITDLADHKIKYYQPRGSSPEFYLPPIIDWHSVTTDATKMLYITEGEKKAAAGCQAGIPVIGIGGNWGFIQKLNDGDRLVVPTTELFTWKDRRVEIIPDSDGWKKEKSTQILSGFYALAMELIERGATVSFLKLPETHGEKVGLDDWLVKEGQGWQIVWEKLERIQLDNSRLKVLTKWFQGWRKKQLPKNGPERGNEKKPLIPTAIFLPGTLDQLSQQAWEAIKTKNTPPRFFWDGNHLILIDNQTNGCSNGPTKSTTLSIDRLRHELSLVARWLRETKEEEFEGCSPPLDVVRDLLVTPNPPVPFFNRLTRVPTFSSDGLLIGQPGYDEASGIFYDNYGLEVSPVPNQPSKEDICSAMHSIKFLINDFPFATQSDKAHAIGLFLLPFVREIIDGPTPLHLIEAPTPGSGKGLLTDALLMPSVGKHIGIITEARNEEEWRKRLTSCFREAYPVILIDNLSRPLDSGTVAGAVTAFTWSDRLLGKNETVSIPVRSLWVVTANNPIISTEIARRTIRVRLDPKVDRPWNREGFQCPNLRKWVMEHRNQLVWSGLVLVQAWLSAGRPRPTCKPLGSFEPWSEVIGGILQYVEVDGFLGNLHELYEVADLEGAAWRGFFEEWWTNFRDKPVGTGELFKVAETIEGLPLGRAESERAFRTSLGKQLAKQRDRIIGDFRLIQAGTIKRALQWKLEFVGTGSCPESVLVVSNGVKEF